MNALAMIHVAKRDLGLDDDTYRAVLVRVTGKESAKVMSEAERRGVVEEMKRLGFKPASKGGRKGLSGPYAKKAQALWIALWNLGAVRSRDDAALLAFVERQTGLKRTEWVRDAAQGRAVIESLKAWCAREGVDWETAGRQGYALRHGCQVAAAQWRKRNPGRARSGFWSDVAEILGRSVAEVKPTDAEWITVMNAWGKEIRGRTGSRRRVA